jgi:hypothetical protein
VSTEPDNLKTRKEQLRQAADDLLRGRPGLLRSRKLAVVEEMLRARESTRQNAIDLGDPRWQLACATRDALQGAVLTYENRRKVMLLAQRVGIRPFDANLIVAIVQDRARRGESIENAAEAISVIPKPVRPARRTATAWVWASAILVAILVDAVLIGWLIFK